MTDCDISKGSINITGNIFRCGGQAITAPGSVITISGVTTSNSVQIVDSSPIVILESLSLQSSRPFTVGNSNILLIFSGANLIAQWDSMLREFGAVDYLISHFKQF
jgi:hypothetical protein